MYPSCSDYGMDLGCAVDSEHSDLAVFAKFWRRVGVAFDFFVDLGTGFEKTSVCENFLGGSGIEESLPGRDNVEL